MGTDMKYISFPGLGIKPFHIDRVAFSVFGRDVAWYGIIICVGIILAVSYSAWRAKKSEGIKSDDVIDIALFLVIFGVIGARLYYVIFEYKRYFVTGKGFLTNLKETFSNIIGIWNGGLAIYGALIAGFVTILVVCRVKKIPFVKMLDVASPACMLGQLIGRWGNFVNIEAYGTSTTLPWRMGIHEPNFANSAEMNVWRSDEYVHPTFLYESLWNLLGFIIANILYKKKKFDGQIFYFYIAWYGFGRMLIEGLRTDSLMLGPIRISQLVGFVTFVVGCALTVVAFRLLKKEPALAGATEANAEADEVLADVTDGDVSASDEAEETGDGEEADEADEGAEADGSECSETADAGDGVSAGSSEEREDTSDGEID